MNALKPVTDDTSREARIRRSALEAVAIIERNRYRLDVIEAGLKNLGQIMYEDDAENRERAGQIMAELGITLDNMQSLDVILITFAEDCGLTFNERTGRWQ